VRCCSLVAEVRTMSKAKTMAVVIRVITTANSVTAPTVEMRVCRSMSGKSRDKLEYVTIVR
jgi:hypothetical protein